MVVETSLETKTAPANRGDMSRISNMRAIVFSLGVAALAACQPAVPDSGAGVGFDSPSAARAREAALSGQGQPQTGPVTVLPPSEAAPVTTTPIDTLATQRSSTNTATTQSAAAAAAPTVGNPNNQRAASPVGISDENNFDAVSQRESIQSDANRIAQNRAQLEVVQPTEVPTRTGNAGPNIVNYALSTSHPVGQSRYKRSGFNGQAKFDRNCAKYPSGDRAQIEFLSRGGPERDRLGLDPDGDGYACSWNPAPYRNAVGGAPTPVAVPTAIE